MCIYSQTSVQHNSFFFFKKKTFFHNLEISLFFCTSKGTRNFQLKMRNIQPLKCLPSCTPPVHFHYSCVRNFVHPPVHVHPEFVCDSEPAPAGTSIEHLSFLRISSLCIKTVELFCCAFLSHCQDECIAPLRFARGMHISFRCI